MLFTRFRRKTAITDTGIPEIMTSEKGSNCRLEQSQSNVQYITISKKRLYNQQARVTSNECIVPSYKMINFTKFRYERELRESGRKTSQIKKKLLSREFFSKVEKWVSTIRKSFISFLALISFIFSLYLSTLKRLT